MALGTIATIAGGAQALLGAGQMIKGLTMPKPDIPEYNIPDEIYKNMTDAEYWSFIGLPEAQKQQFIDQSAQQGAEALSRSSSRKAGMGLVTSIAEQQRQGSRDLLVADTEARMKNLQTFWGAREKIASEKSIKQQFDLGKIETERAERRETIGASVQNIAGAASLFGTMASMGEFGGKKGGKKGVAEIAAEANVAEELV